MRLPLSWQGREAEFEGDIRGQDARGGVDHTVTYRNNVKAGTTPATIMGCSKVWTFEPPKSMDDDFIVEKNKQRFFTGSKSVTFKIVK